MNRNFTKEMQLTNNYMINTLNTNRYESFFNQTDWNINKELITSHLGEDMEKRMLSLPGEEHNPFTETQEESAEAKPSH